MQALLDKEHLNLVQLNKHEMQNLLDEEELNLEYQQQNLTVSSFRHFVPLIYQELLNSLEQICNVDHCLVVWAQLVLLSPASVYNDYHSLATWLRVRPTCVFMWQKLEQGADSVELHQDVVLIRHRGDDVHLLKDVIQLQLGLHESDKKKKNPLCRWHAAVKEFFSVVFLLPHDVLTSTLTAPNHYLGGCEWGF